MSKDTLVVPILENFDAARPIGELRILKSALPPTASFVFSIGYKRLDPQVDNFYDGDYELVAVSPICDTAYSAFLKKPVVMSDEENKMIHILRNPWGWSEDEVRAARLWAADRIDPTGRHSECKCDMRTKLVGDGCSVCNIKKYQEMIKEEDHE